jgi:hypothetical protein
LFSKEADGIWTYPRVVLARADCPFFSVDGSRIYFRAAMDPDGDGDGMDGIWYYNIEDTAFQHPELLDIDVGRHGFYWQFSLDRQGNVYSGSPSGMVRCRKVNGRYEEPELLSEVLHEGYIGGSPYIAPDGTYILFNSGEIEDTFGSGDIYVGFRTEDGKWSAPINLGVEVNTPGQDILPMVSGDGKYLFFVSGFGSIMWIDHSVIERKRKE